MPTINLDVVTKLIEYHLKNVLAKAVFTLTIFKVSLFKARSVL